MKNYIYLCVTLVITLVTNTLANILPFNGQTTAQVSDKYFTYFAPANYVFSIWGLIYLSLIVLVIYLGLNLKKNSEYLNKIAPWLIIVNLVNSVWLFAWHYEYILLTVVLMLVILVCLIKAYLLNYNLKNSSKLLLFPLSVYLGWISVATVANVSALLVSLGLNLVLVPNQLYTLIMVFVALLLGVLMVKLKRDYAYFLVIVWAVVGIIVKFQTDTTIYSGATMLLLTSIAFAIPIAFKPLK